MHDASAELLELSILFGAKVADDVGMSVGFSEKHHFTVSNCKTVWQQPFHSNLPAIVFTLEYKSSFAAFT